MCIPPKHQAMLTNYSHLTNDAAKALIESYTNDAAYYQAQAAHLKKVLRLRKKYADKTT